MPVNRAFADAVLAELDAQPDAAVFFHDYHLYLAPRFVRDARPDASLAHFVHIPWPEPNLWRVLPERIRHAIHDGLLANDVVGFHAHRWRRSFLRSSRDLLDADCDFDSQHLLVRATGGRSSPRARSRSTRPSSRSSPRASRCCGSRRSSSRAGPSSSILRVDRTDPSKNVVRGFRAFEFYLDAHPEMHGRVGMLALLDPSRQDIPGVRGVPRRDPARGADGQRPLPAGGLDARSTCGSRTTSRSRSPRTSSTTCCS